MVYSYQFSDNMTIGWLVKNMPTFLFPDLSKQQARITKPFIGILALKDQQPVGLILASSENTHTIYRIHSFLVHPNFHQQGIGHTLLEKLSKIIQQRGGKKIEATYRNHWQYVPAIQCLLNKQQWTKPKPQLVLANGKVSDALSFFSKFGTPKSTFSFLSFTQLKISDVDYIQKKQANTQWFDPDLSPFTAQSSIHPACSFLVKREGEIIGWIVSHQLKKDLNELTALFIDEAYRSFKLTHLLIRTVFEKQLSLGIPRFLTTSKVNGNAVAKLMRRAGEQSDIFCTTAFYTCKALEV